MVGTWKQSPPVGSVVNTTSLTPDEQGVGNPTKPKAAPPTPVPPVQMSGAQPPNGAHMGPRGLSHPAPPTTPTTPKYTQAMPPPQSPARPTTTIAFPPSTPPRSTAVAVAGESFSVPSSPARPAVGPEYGAQSVPPSPVRPINAPPPQGQPQGSPAPVSRQVNMSGPFPPSGPGQRPRSTPAPPAAAPPRSAPPPGTANPNIVAQRLMQTHLQRSASGPIQPTPATPTSGPHSQSGTPTTATFPPNRFHLPRKSSDASASSRGGFFGPPDRKASTASNVSVASQDTSNNNSLQVPPGMNLKSGSGPSSNSSVESNNDVNPNAAAPHLQDSSAPSSPLIKPREISEEPPPFSPLGRRSSSLTRKAPPLQSLPGLSRSDSHRIVPKDPSSTPTSASASLNFSAGHLNMSSSGSEPLNASSRSVESTVGSPPSTRMQIGSPVQQGRMRSESGENSPMRNRLISRTSSVSSPKSPKKSPRSSKIDPNQIPRPAKSDTTKRFHTRSSSLPPSATSSFIAIDEGNCNPRFMRLSINQIPNTGALMKTSELPFGTILQPLADLAVGEDEVPLVDTSSRGPIRCASCKAYLNPFWTFFDGGRQMKCNLCAATMKVPAEYFCPLDADGRRRDREDRPELCKGSVDFLANGEYVAKAPAPLCFFILLDVSAHSVQSGLLQTTVSGVKAALEQMVAYNPKAQVGIMTYDTNVNCWDFGGRGCAKMYVMNQEEGEEPFLPIPADRMMASVEERKEDIIKVLDSLESIHSKPLFGDSSFSSALTTVTIALAGRGGRVMFFHSQIPIKGAGRLPKRDDTRLYGTDKERKLFEPQNEVYVKFAKQCVDEGICLDIFSCCPGYNDLGTLGYVASATGGTVHYYPHFDAATDGEKMYHDVFHTLTRRTGSDGVLRVRVSQGIFVSQYHGNFTAKTDLDVDLAGVDSDTTYAVFLKHDGKLKDESECGIQCAMLYTTSAGERRIRVHNLSVPTTTILGNVFRYADLDTITNLWVRNSVKEALEMPLAGVRDNLTHKCISALYVYRKFCATSTSTGQLILPESLKLLPLYTLAMTKNPAFRSGTDVRADERVFWMQQLICSPLSLTIPMIYPRLYRIDELEQGVGTKGKNGEVILPTVMSLSSEKINNSDLLLLDNGQTLYLKLGRSAERHVLMDLMGASSLETIDPTKGLPLLENPLSAKVHEIIRCIRSSRSVYPSLCVVKPRELIETKFCAYLVEDRTGGSHSYVEYLCYVHRQIQSRFA